MWLLTCQTKPHKATLFISLSLYVSSSIRVQAFQEDYLIPNTLFHVVSSTSTIFNNLFFRIEFPCIQIKCGQFKVDVFTPFDILIFVNYAIFKMNLSRHR